MKSYSKGYPVNVFKKFSVSRRKRIMKARRFLMFIVLIITASVVIISGCKYDVAQPQWDKPFTAPASPTIDQIVPSEAMPGVNTITINGTNFGMPPDDTTTVYFDKETVEIISISSTSITVRRPSTVSDSCMIKVVSNRALLVAKKGPYKVDPVIENYGSFLDNLPLAVLTTDNAENLYVIEQSSRNINKVTPDGNRTVVGVATRIPYDAVFGPDGRMYLPENNKSIDVADFTADTVKEWTKLPSGRNVKFGDFDAKGNFYTGGTRSDLVILPPNPPAAPTAADIKTANAYISDEILAIRVHDGYVYVVSRDASLKDPAKIWRHQIFLDRDSLGAKELVYDMSNTGDLSSKLIKAISFSSNGKIFIATDDTDPLLVYDPGTQTVDIFYKNIVPSNCKDMCWGTGNYIYIISGNTTPAVNWIVYKIDMGTTSAP
jgi:hypothetical protein